MARIDNLTNFLTDVASAIKTKTEDPTNIPAVEFDERIMNIKSGGMDYANTNLSIDKIVDKSMGYSSFSRLYPLRNMINMSGAFMDNRDITYIPYISTMNITDMSNMFNGCANLTDLPMLNMANVTNAEGMFVNCDRITYESAANIANMLPLALNLTNQTLANLGLRSDQFYQSSVQILIDKGYTDAALAYNPYPEYILTIDN